MSATYRVVNTACTHYDHAAGCICDVRGWQPRVGALYTRIQVLRVAPRVCFVLSDGRLAVSGDTVTVFEALS